VTTYGTTDGGLSWHLDPIGNNINRFRMLSDTLGYALGRHVYKYSTEKVTDVEFEFDVQPLSFVLEQNYPNPFNPSTIINYTLPEEAYVIIKIYDSLGNEVQTLLKQRQATGKHQVEFNGNNLPSGIYLYKLEARDFIETKKMVLLK